MEFDATKYGPPVAELLHLDGDGNRLMPLARGECSTPDAVALLKSPRLTASLSGAKVADAALAGLWLYFSCMEQSHEISQGLNVPEGAYWHGILHRQEPDAWNAKYWFRQVGNHPIHDRLRDEAAAISGNLGTDLHIPELWDPAWFVDLCDEIWEMPKHRHHQAALEIQRAEWQLLFDYCAT